MTDEICEVCLNHAPDEMVREVLEKNRVIAVVGLSTNPEKDANRVPKYMQIKGYRVIPVHPKADSILGEKAYKDLRDIPEQVEIVNVFRPPSELPGIVDAAIEIGAKVLWSQEGIVNHNAADKAEKAGIKVIMDKCMYKEYKVLFDK